MIQLKEGEKAPVFVGVDELGNEMSLTQFQGKKLILYFYPKDNTPGCTMEAKNLRDNFELLRSKGFEIVGVSPDTMKKHQNFIEKHDLPFHLLADTDKKVLNDYGVWGKKKFMGREYDGVHRTTFVIDGNGVIVKIFKKVKTKAHAEQILEALKL